MANPDSIEWVPNSLCENPSISFPKESVTALIELVVICQVIVVFGSSIQTVFTGVSRVVPEYKFSQIIIYTQMRNGQRVVAVHNCVNVAFLSPFFCVRNVRETKSTR